MGSEWVEIVEPRTRERMYANLISGECVWEPPSNVSIKHSTDAQWWELFDPKTSRYYYYNGSSQKTVWHRPKEADIVSLVKLQSIKSAKAKMRKKAEAKKKSRRSAGLRVSGTRTSSKRDSVHSSDTDSNDVTPTHRTSDSHKRRHRMSGGKTRRSGDSLQVTANNQTGNISTPSHYSDAQAYLSNNGIESDKNAMTDDPTQWAHSDDLGSMDSAESKPKQAKIQAHSQTLVKPKSSAGGGLHARSKSQDASAGLSVQLRDVITNTQAERSSLSKSQSFPQHSAPVKKDYRKSSNRSGTSNAGEMERFAKRNLSVHTKGLLRKKITIHTMLSWTREPIRKPMIMTKTKQVKKEACEVFKLVQAYMGDKKVKRPESVPLDIITMGWQNPDLRDEIFIQLCRQTTANPRSSSMERGLEMIAMCLYFFPPSNKFHSYLEGYISSHLNSPDVDEVKISHYAEVSCKRLEKILLTGAKRGNRKPTADEITQSQTSIFNPSMFGSSLQEVLEIQEKRYPGRRLPWVMTTLSEEVLRLEGNKTEGIFRVPGDIDEVNVLKVKLDKWNLPNNLRDPHVPGSLLKLWFRELEEPLIPSQFYDRCVDNCSNASAAIEVVYELPEVNRLCLSYLIRFLQTFSQPEYSKITKMDASNLAMVMAPNCLRCMSDDPRIIFENTRKEMSYIRTLVLNYDTSFMEGIA